MYNKTKGDVYLQSALDKQIVYIWLRMLYLFQFSVTAI